MILDRDLAALYGISTKVFNQAVKRNKQRFPNDFAFQLTQNEKEEVVTNCDHLQTLKFSPVLPYAFTEHGALMAATILNSKRATLMSIYVIRAFVRMRDALSLNEVLTRQLAEIDKTLLTHDAALRDLYEKVLPLLTPLAEPERKKIGFHP